MLIQVFAVSETFFVRFRFAVVRALIKLLSFGFKAILIIKKVQPFRNLVIESSLFTLNFLKKMSSESAGGK